MSEKVPGLELPDRKTEGETVKKYTLPLVMWVIFETIAITLWLTKNNKKAINEKR